MTAASDPRKPHTHWTGVGGTGLEQTANSSKKTASEETTDAQNDAQAVELALVADRWRSLTPAVRCKILKLVVSAPG